MNFRTTVAQLYYCFRDKIAGSRLLMDVFYISYHFCSFSSLGSVLMNQSGQAIYMCKQVYIHIVKSITLMQKAEMCQIIFYATTS